MTEPAHGDGDPGDEPEIGSSDLADENDAPVPFADAGTVELPARFTTLKQIYPVRHAEPRATGNHWLHTHGDGEPARGTFPERHPLVSIILYLLAVTAVSVAVAAALIPFRGTIQAYKNGGLDAGVADEAFAAVAALLVMARITEKRHASDVGYDRRGIISQTISGILIGAAIAVATLWLMEAAQTYRMFGPHARMSPWLPMAVCLSYAVAEETIFRGYVFRVIENRYGSLIALAGTAAIATALQTAGAGTAVPFANRIFGEALAATSSGLLLGAAYVATRRLWLPIAIQWSWSFFVGPVFGMNLSNMGVVTAAWCHPQILGSFLRSGSGLGPAASLASCAVWTFAGALMLRRAIISGEWKPLGERIANA